MHRQTLCVLGLATVLTGALAAGRGVLKAAPAPELSAQQVLTRTAENYRGATGYAFTGEVATRMTVNDEQQNIVTRLEGAYGGPGKSRLSASTGSDSSLYVTAGDSTWSYSSRLAQFTRQAVDLAVVARGLPGLDPRGPHPFAGYENLDRGVASVRLAGRDTVQVGSRTVFAYVLEVAYDSTVTSVTDSGALFSAKRFVIDPERFLVLGDRVTVERTHPMLSKPIQIVQEATYERISWNVPPPDSTFTFKTPVGGTLVEQLGAVTQTAPEAESKLVGKPAPEFTLEDLAGKSKRLGAFKGKVVLIDFWATWCGPCRIEMPEIEKLHAKYGSKGLVVLGVNCKENPAKARTFVQKYGYTFPILLDRDGAVAGRYGIEGIPTVVVVDKQGEVAAHLVGARSGSELVAALNKAGLSTGP